MFGREKERLYVVSVEEKKKKRKKIIAVLRFAGQIGHHKAIETALFLLSIESDYLDYQLLRIVEGFYYQIRKHI